MLGEHSEKLTFVDTSITFGEEGIFVGNTETNVGVLIGTNRISFMDKGVEVASISDEVLRINSGLFVRNIQVGNHLIETITGTDITVFKSVD